jgi:hypothetical protein
MRYVEEVSRAAAAAAANKQSATKREGVFLIYYFSLLFYFHVVFATSAPSTPAWFLFLPLDSTRLLALRQNEEKNIVYKSAIIIPERNDGENLLFLSYI